MTVTGSLFQSGDILADRLKDELRLHFRKFGSEKLLGIRTTRLIRKPFSTVRFIEVPTSSQVHKLVVKTIEHHAVNKAITKKENQALVEHNILQHLYPKFQPVSKCSVPRPILVIPEIDTFVMEHVKGTLLENQLRYVNHLFSISKFHEIEDRMYLCGRWLKCFQEFTGEEQSGVDVLSTSLERIEYRVRVLEDGTSPKWPKGYGPKIMSFLDKQLASLKDHDIRVTGRHGDFGPWNVISRDDGITVIDFLGYKMDLISLDFIKMQLFLEELKCDFATNSIRVGLLQERFTDGFGSLPLVPDPILRICEVLHRVCSIFGCVTYTDGRFRHQMERKRRLNKNLEWVRTFGWNRKLWPVS